MDELTIPFLGPERAAWQYPFRSLLAAGAILAMGSDWSVSTADPLLEMEVAVTRIDDEERGAQPAVPARRAARRSMDALAGFTNGHGLGQPPRGRGRVDRGRARRRTWSSSIATCSTAAPAPIGEARVVATFIDGVAVHEAPALEG